MQMNTSSCMVLIGSHFPVIVVISPYCDYSPVFYYTIIRKTFFPPDEWDGDGLLRLLSEEEEALQ